MITAIDTNIIIDILGADAEHGLHSANLLRHCLQEGKLCACEVVWAETASLFSNEKQFLNAMETLGIHFSPNTQESAILSGQIWHTYIQNGGKQQRVVADFLIGAHAIVQADRLLTRDRGFYRNYFKSLKIIDPSNNHKH